MIKHTPRATWLKKRAHDCRAKAKSNPLKSAELIRMAFAYEALARQVPQGAEIGELQLKELKAKKRTHGQAMSQNHPTEIAAPR